MRVLRDLLRDGEIFVANIIKIAGKGRKSRHQKCVFFSQLGNVWFPTWEQFIPNVGTLRSTNGNLKTACSEFPEQASLFR